MIRPSRQSGNVLFYILIGVMLFAALGFAVSQMMRGGGGAPVELETTTASAVLEYADTVRTAVQAMEAGGVEATKICFDNQGWGNAVYNFAACSDSENKVFDPDGGGVTWEKNSGDVNNTASWLFTGTNGIQGMGMSCTNASCADLVMILTGLSKATCAALNTQLGITNPNGNPPVDTGYDATPFIGVYTSSGTGNIGDETNSAGLANQPAGCFQSSSVPVSNSYNFYRVLISR